MVKKLKKIIYPYIFSDDIPIEAKMLNVVFFCGIFFASAAVITRILMGAKPFLILVGLFIVLSIAVLIYISNRFHLYTACTWITIIAICDIFLPAAYFLLGGVAGSSVAYFVLSLVLVFLLSKGRGGMAFCVTHLMLVFACYYISYRYPNLVARPAYRNFFVYLDHIQSFLIVGGCIGVIFKFQNKVYFMEKKKEVLARAEILQQDKLLRAVKDAAETLFSPDTDRFEEFLREGMEILARCVDVDRVFIWKTRIIDGDAYHQPVFHWAKDPGQQANDLKSFYFFRKAESVGTTQFFKKLSINGPVTSLDPELRDLIAPYGARSTLMIPLFLHNQVWGFVSFDDCRRERYFSSSEENILRSGSLLLADAAIRNETTQNLIDAREEALASTKAKSRFLARMSHEIRTPLNAILGLSEVELQNVLPNSTRLNLEKIYGSGSHLLEIVNDILDISKIESGNFEIFPTGYEFAGLINDTVQLNITRIGSKPIEFKLEIDETIPSGLYGDEVRVKQILNNLLSNAFKYTDAGEIRLSITWERQGDDAWLRFTVKDTGRGIKKEDLAKLFSEYTQFDTAANRRIEGTGLGLSITKGLVEKMMGTITVESEYLTGSVFRVTLPQGILDEKPIGGEMVENLRNFRFIEDRGRSRGNTLIRSWMPYGKVLVVDDLETNLDVMKGLLMPYGLRVDTVLSGREAVERIRAEEVRYDLIFMDHMMPEMDGMEAARIIRNEIGSPYARQVIIVALTANAVAGNREMFLENGFNDFIPKPIDIKRLDMALNCWIRDKQSEAVLQDAEQQNLARTAGFNQGQLDEAGTWILKHPLEEIDFAAALMRYGNSGAVYIPMLTSFVTHTPLLLEKMGIHLETSLPDYAIEVHGLKGTCNAIGAGGIAALAGELELAAQAGNVDLIRQNDGRLRKQALALTERLNALLDEWEAGLPKEEKEPRAEPERALLARLSTAAAEFNSSVTEEILGELDRYRYEQGQEIIEWLREQAENFDYDAIHKRLEEFLGTI
ncbi:ATP-binding protein [Treponema sp. TIM-1]|uniref:GAF domain-containing hybrid sensor histidine kinase/response regulator n=1 Tax=Treponema sp. TIM-1 TaxID=2898417 RepID=UPI00397EC7A3